MQEKEEACVVVILVDTTLARVDRFITIERRSMNMCRQNKDSREQTIALRHTNFGEVTFSSARDDERLLDPT